MNKKGAQQIGVLGILGIIAAVIFVLYIFGAFKGGTSTQNVILTNPISLTFSGYNKAQPGTTFTPDEVYVSLNGASFNDDIEEASQGDIIEIVAVESGYHNAYVPAFALPKDKTTKIIEIPFNLRASSASITIYNEDGEVDDQEATEGASYVLPVKFKGQDGASTQDMRCILEITDASLIKEMKLTGFPGASYKGKDKPSWYTTAGANSGIWVYDISAIEGAVNVNGNLAIVGKSGQTLAGETATITCYSKEHFIDSYTGKHMYDVEDSQGNSQYVDSYTQSINFVASA